MNIKLSKISVGNQKIQLPIWESQSKTPGKTIIVTAGTDGDEYVGIEAAYELIRFYSYQKFPGKITIVPIVNVFGFAQTMSHNPIDNVYPKHIYPGKKSGSSSEQLLFFLSETYISKADIWIDLHGGAVNEQLAPFVWTWETGNTSVDLLMKNIISHVAGMKVFDQNKWDKVQALAKQNVAYILLESGQLGQRKPIDIKRHVKWVKKIIGVVQQNKKARRPQTQVYTRVNCYKTFHDGLWYPHVKLGDVSKGQKLGEVISIAGKRLETFKALQQGTVLWSRTSLNTTKGEVLVAIATY